VTILRSYFANRWVRYGLTITLLALVLLKINLQRVTHAISSANPEYLIVALLMTAPFLYLKSVRWYLLLRAGGVEATLGEATVSLIGGMGLALLTPARLGELVRVAYLRGDEKLKVGGLVLIDKGLDVVVLLTLSVPGAAGLLGPGAGIAIGLLALAGLMAVYRPQQAARALQSAFGRLPLGSKLDQLWTSLEALSPLKTSVFLAITFLAFAVVFLQFGVILLSWRNWSLDVVLLTFPLVILTNVLPLTIGGLGIREGTAAALLSHYGVLPADAAVVAFISFAMNTALPGLIGAFLLPVTGRPAKPGIPVRDRP
jgi:glycosyltransferase 2 family protein